MMYMPAVPGEVSLVVIVFPLAILYFRSSASCYASFLAVLCSSLSPSMLRASAFSHATMAPIPTLYTSFSR